MPDLGFHNYFGPQASRYREYRPRYPAALFQYLALAAGEAAVAWDCATGNGQAAVQLAEHFARVIATDPSGEMIEEWSLSEFASYVRTWSAVNNLIGDRGEEPVVALELALAERWGAPTQRRPVKWPVHFRIGKIR